MSANADHAVGELPGRGRRMLIMGTAIVASAMYMVDLTVVGIALPYMQATFGATPDQISWVVTASVLGSTAMIVATGWLSAQIGGKRLFIISIATFMALSVLAAQARTLEEEVLWRLLMGAFGAAIVPLCQVIVMNVYPRKEHGRALAVWGVGTMAAPLIALPLGGVIIELFGWPGVFYMNLPVAGLAILSGLAFVPRAEAEPQRSLDWFGFLLLIVIFGLLQYVLSRGARLDWLDSTVIVAALVVVAVCAYLVVVHLLTTQNPLIPPELFRDRNFTFGLIGTFVFAATNMTIIILLPLMLRNQLNYPIVLIGLIVATRNAGSIVGQYIVAYFVSRVDPRHLITFGVLTAASATWIMAGWSVDVSPWQVVWPVVLHGVSGGSLWVSFNSLTVSTLDARLRPHGVPFYYLTFNIGFSLGVAAILTYWSNSAQTNHARLAEHVTPFNQAMRSPLLPPGWDLSDPATAATLADEISRQAGMIAYINSFALVTVAALFIIPLGYLLANPGWRAAR